LFKEKLARLDIFIEIMGMDGVKQGNKNGLVRTIPLIPTLSSLLLKKEIRKRIWEIR
jgi:hypothetical protein